ncbi:MAG: class I cytochrome c [Methylotenera sp.]|uniref:c-type cytochrome n=1 Tax=Methylotenera sp. TaxID=2051956 RepID=UPI002489648D|nr:class I cytochrome c [Methylotenera sp.]MDI1309936.1 class I cytochrome c [Methylotenera sp.]
MKPIQITGFLALILITSVCIPHIGNAAEVSVFSDTQNVHIRQLAASCAACHGSQGNSVATNVDDGANAVLAGVAPAEFTEKMLGFKDGSRKATVMHHHAKGLTVDEINQLAVHFSQQKRVVSKALKSQTLKADHE